LLGDDVADQFDRIDSELDLLEGLVDSIETNLRILAEVELSGTVEGTTSLPSEEMPEAA